MYVLFHRPVSAQSHRADVWLSRSADLRSWTASEPVLQSRSGPWWDATRIGMGPPPIETPHGWLCFYHGVKQMVATSIYRVGIMLLDLDDPTKVLRRTPSWVLGPDAPYERIGDVPNVVFPTGLVHDEESDELRLYYGAADSTIAVATGPLLRGARLRADLPETLMLVRSPQGPARPARGPQVDVGHSSRGDARAEAHAAPSRTASPMATTCARPQRGHRLAGPQAAHRAAHDAGRQRRRPWRVQRDVRQPGDAVLEPRRQLLGAVGDAVGADRACGSRTPPPSAHRCSNVW